MNTYLKYLALILSFLPFSSNAWVASEIQEYLNNNPSFAEINTAVSADLGKNGNVILAHGIAAYEGDFEKSRLVAQSDAYIHLADLIASPKISAFFKDKLSERNGSISKETLSSNKIERESLIPHTRTKAYWIDEDFFHIILAIYIDAEPTPEKADLNEEFYNIELDDTWAGILEQNRDIWLGGLNVVLNPKDNKYYAITLVSAKDDKAEYLIETILKNFALRELAKYLKGVEFKNKMESITRIKSTTTNGEEDIEFFKKFNSISTEELFAALKALNKVGTLKHKTSKRKYALYVKDLNDF